MSKTTRPQINDGEVSDFACIMALFAVFFILLMLALYALGVPL